MLMWLIVLVFIIIEAKDSPESSIKDFFPFFNTITGYQSVHGSITIPKPDCKPLQIWMLVRHGTRYPKSKHLAEFLNLPKLQAEILKNHKNKAGQLSSKDLKNLRQWKLNKNINKEKAGFLIPEAEEDIRSLAKRIQNAYPELLKVNPKKIKSTDYIFRTTNTPRTQGTLKIFLSTLFGNTEIINSMQSSTHDAILTPFKNCPEWKSSIEATHSKDERKKFQSSFEIKALLNTMSKRLGFSQTIEFATIESMYKMCGFEISWYSKKSSVWCRLFTNDELKLLEFYNDLSSYYRVGPGRPMSSKFGCVLLKDMFKYFKNVEEKQKDDEPKGIFYFSHSSTIQVFLSALKIGKEPKLSATSYHSAEKRNYRTSLLVPFTTNIIATLYKCTGKTSEFKVMFHIAERATPIVGCPDGFCDWKILQKELQSVLALC